MLQASQLWRDNEALIEELARQGEAEGAKLALKGTFATRRGTQFVALARKYRLSYWRSPSYNLTRMIMTLLICLFYGTMFYGRGRLPTTGEINPFQFLVQTQIQKKAAPEIQAVAACSGAACPPAVRSPPIPVSKSNSISYQNRISKPRACCLV